MARPLLDLRARFASEIAIWDQALANGGTIWHADDPNDAIRITMRLNIYRKHLRANTPNGLIMEDRYVVSRKDATITIRERTPIKGFGTRLDGTPLLTPDDAIRHIAADPLDLETS